MFGISFTINIPILSFPVKTHQLDRSNPRWARWILEIQIMTNGKRSQHAFEHQISIPVDISNIQTKNTVATIQSPVEMGCSFSFYIN